MKIVDGARGEGGGQVVRHALALAAATGVAVRIVNVRAGRENPGLRPQHVAVARALAEVTGGEVEGAETGSSEVSLRPGALAGGEYHFTIPTAGSITLLLQGLLPAALASRRAFTFSLQGGTDVPFAPTWDYFARVELALLERMGVHAEAELSRRGFYPAGGGEARVALDGAGARPHDFTERGQRLAVRGRVFGNGLPKHVLQRAAEAARDALVPDHPSEIEIEHHRGPGTGMGVTLVAEYERSTLGADALGKRGLPAEEVGMRAAHALRAELAAGAVVDAHAADMLPVHLAIAGGGRYLARPLSGHARTVLDLLPEFLPVRADVAPRGRLVEVTIAQA